jgi:hypothetical protein
MSDPILGAVLVVGAVIYAAVALIVYGWNTQGGNMPSWSERIWAALWPLAWSRIPGDRVRWWWQRHVVEREDYGTFILHVKAQRLDRWLVKLGEEWACAWLLRHEEVVTDV